MSPQARSAPRTALTLAMVTLLAGCATLERAPPGDGPGDLLAFYRHAGALEGDDLTSAYHRFRNWVREGHCGPDRIRLAMLIMQAKNGPASEADAGGVLAPCLGEADQEPQYLRHLARMLDGHLRLKGRIDRLKAEREQVKQGLTQCQRQCRALEAQRDKLRKRVDSLEKQLDALKDIERSIRQRN